MKAKFSSVSQGVTPERLMRAIRLAIIYASPSDMQLKQWMESESQEKVINEICDLIEASVDKKIWKKLKI